MYFLWFRGLTLIVLIWASDIELHLQNVGNKEVVFTMFSLFVCFAVGVKIEKSGDKRWLTFGSV